MSTYNSCKQYRYNTREPNTFCKHVPKIVFYIKFANLCNKEPKRFQNISINGPEDCLREIGEKNKETALQVLKAEWRTATTMF